MSSTSLLMPISVKMQQKWMAQWSPVAAHAWLVETADAWLYMMFPHEEQIKRQDGLLDRRSPVRC